MAFSGPSLEGGCLSYTFKLGGNIKLGKVFLLRMVQGRNIRKGMTRNCRFEVGDN
jgi:hypothetical protein